MSIQIIEWEGEREGAKERQWKREIGRQRESEGERERTFFGTKSKHVYQGIAAQGTAQVLFRHGSSSSYDTHQKQGGSALIDTNNVGSRSFGPSPKDLVLCQ
jgi:hypothetical protein